MPGGSSPDPFRARGDVKISNIFNQLGKFQRVCPRSLAKTVLPLQERASGEMAEWLKAHAWKACVRETVPWVRIPLSPPNPLENTRFLWLCYRQPQPQPLPNCPKPLFQG